MIRTAIISVTASFVLFGVWAVNLVSYHPAPDLNPLAPLTPHLLTGVRRRRVNRCGSLKTRRRKVNVEARMCPFM